MIAPLDRIELALAQLGAEHEPPAGWEARVLAQIGAAQRRRRPRWTYTAPGLALAAALAILVFRPPGPPEVSGRATEAGAAVALSLDVQVSDRRLARRSQRGERQIGDVVHVTVSGGARRRAVRIYRNEIRLVMRCPGDPACRPSDEALTADFTLSEVGTYTIVALTSSSSLPPLPGSYDADTAAARRAGASLDERELHVR